MSNIDKQSWIDEEKLWKLNSIVSDFQSRIKNVIWENYWVEDEKKVSEFFERISKMFVDRNKKILDFLSSSWFEFIQDFEFSGWLDLDKWDLENIDWKVLSIINRDSLFMNKDWTLLSRWYEYYFNIDWFVEDDNKNIEFDPEMFFSRINELIEGYSILIGYLMKKDKLNSSEKKLLLMSLDNLININLFFINMCMIFRSEEWMKTVMKFKQQAFNNFILWDPELNIFTRFSDCIDNIPNDMEFLEEYTYKLISTYCDLLLNNDYRWDSNFYDESLLLKVIVSYFKDIFQHQIDRLDREYERFWDEWNKSFIKKLKNVFLQTTIRVHREQDNPLKMLLTSNNIANKLKNEDKSRDINILWILYWWIWMPFYLKYMMERFYWFDKSKLWIVFTIASRYHLRNLKKIWNRDNYPNSIVDNTERYIILDDNSQSWSTLQDTINTVWSESIVLESGVAEVWVRRWKIWKLFNRMNVPLILSKAMLASDRTPIMRMNSKWTHKYESMVWRRIKRKLPWIIGRF